MRKVGLPSQLASGGAGALLAAATGAAGIKTAMSDAECAAALARAPLLRSLHAAEILAIVAHGVRRVRCPRGEVHVRQGSPGGSMYVVLAGRFDVLVKVSGVFFSFFFFPLFYIFEEGGGGKGWNRALIRTSCAKCCRHRHHHHANNPLLSAPMLRFDSSVIQ